MLNRTEAYGTSHYCISRLFTTGLCIVLIAICATARVVGASSAQPLLRWGSYLKPFAADSLWNSHPVSPVFGEFVIPPSDYLPAVQDGQWSTGVFLSQSSDGPVTVTGLPGTAGLWDPDAEVYKQSITIPHWPSNVVPAAASDGHADVVDPMNRIVHSFFQLQYQNGQWVAGQYAWTSITGRGWGDPAHYFQGSRATGVATMAGLIRKNEVMDGDTLYRHALAMSLTFNALSAISTYSFPATSADSNASTTNSGQIPEGTLMMLPPSFDTTQISNAALRKVAETLKVYGAYVVDRNSGTPFVIYVENGSNFNLYSDDADNRVASNLDTIRQSLRQVVSVDGWINGNGQSYNSPNKNLNLLSMRGQWSPYSGTALGYFDTWTQAVMFPSTTSQMVQVNYSSRGLSAVSWALPAVGATYQLTPITTGGAKLRLQIYDKAADVQRVVFDTGDLENGQAVSFTWPAKDTALILYATSGVGQVSTVRGTLVSAP